MSNLSTGPVLVADSARIAVAQAVALDALSFSTRGNRILLGGGDAAPLLAVLSGTPGGIQRAPDPAEASEPAELVAGSLRLLGREVGSGEHFAVAGVTPLDPQAPLDWTVLDYLGWGARLSGASAASTLSLASAALDRLHIAGHRRRHLQLLNRVERRAVALALAVVNDPEVLVVPEIFDGVDEQAANFLAATLGHASDGRAVIAAVSHISPHGVIGRLARSASDIIVLRRGQLMAHAAPHEVFSKARVYELTVRSRAEELGALLAQRGVQLCGGPLHFSVHLPTEIEPWELLAAAAQSEAAVVSIVPLLGGS